MVLMLSLLCTEVYSQLPNGSIAPDFTLTDIDGVTWNLYDELNDGKSVVIDIGATWCGPCWTYHQSGVLEDLYTTYGPNGTDQIRVFMVEGDSDTNEACLYGTAGCNDATYGDWTAGVDYPIFSPVGAIADDFISDYQLGYWPTLYGISPIDYTTQLINQADFDTWESWLIDSWYMDATYTTVDSDCPYEGMVDLEPILGFGNLSYEWSNGDDTEDLIDVPAGNYSVTITDQHNVDIVVDNIIVGGTDAAQLEVEQLWVEDNECNGDSNGQLTVASVGGSGGYSYSWSTGDIGEFIFNLSAGDYDVTCTDSDGCIATQTFTVGEPDVLTAGSSPITTTCAEDNGFVYLFADGGTTPFSYDIGTGATPNGSFSGLASGDYIATITDVNGCLTTESFVIAPSEAPEAVASADESINCYTPQVEVSAANSTTSGNANYSWTTTDGNIVGSADNEMIMVDQPGTYELTLVEIPSGCISETSIYIAADSDTPQVSIADADMINCTVTQVTLDGSMSSQGDNLSYVWTTANGNIVTDETGSTVEVDSEGTYTLSITNMENGCFAASTITVQADIEEPSVTVDSGTLTCDHNMITICATITEGQTITWSKEGVEVSSMECIEVDAPGDYLATVVAPNGCSSEATAVVTASTDLPMVSISDPQVITCEQPSVTIVADISGDISDQNIVWTDADGYEIASGTNEIEVHVGGTYDLSVTNSSGCEVLSSVTVDEDINLPQAGIDYTLDTDGLVTLQNTSTTTGTVIYTVDGASIDSDTYSFDTAGEVELCIVLTNECGIDTECTTVAFGGVLAMTLSKSDLTCFESNDGNASAQVTGGLAEYQYEWVGPNGYASSDSEIYDLTVGVYTVNVTDANGTIVTNSVEITQPSDILLSSAVVVDEDDSTENGSIDVIVTGGTGTLTYTWSNGETTSNIIDLGGGEYSLIVSDENNCSKEFGPYIVNSVVGIEDLSIISKFNMYPVPAHSLLNVSAEITTDQPVMVRVQNTTGQTMWSKTYSNDSILEEIDLASYNSGLYTLTFISGNEVETEKFIVLK